MSVYVVAYEQQSRGCDSAGVREALQSLGAERILSGLYLVDTPTDAQSLHRHLSDFLEGEDRIFVTRLTEDFSGYVFREAGPWLDIHKPF